MSKAIWVLPFLICASASLLSAAPEQDAQQEGVLDELDAALRKQGPFRVVISYACQELEISGTLTLSFSALEGRMLMRRKGTSPAESSSAYFEPGSATYWSAEGAQRFVYELKPLLEGLYGFQNSIAVSKGEPALSREAFATQVGPQIQIGIGAHAMETRPTLEVGLGISTRTRSSWVSELRDDGQRKLVTTPDEVKAERPGGRSYVIDRKTGFFRSQRLVLQRSTFTLAAGPLQALEAFPEVTPPTNPPTQELPVHVLVDMLRGLVLTAATSVDLDAEGAALEQVAKGYTLLAASAAQVRLHHLARSEARAYVQDRLEAGATPESLRAAKDKEAAELAKHLATALAGIEREEERELAVLRKAVLVKVAGDSPQAKALVAALSVEVVRAARAKPASALSHLEAVLASLR